jgi:trigger factor
MMPANVENLGTLERRVSMRVPLQDIERQVEAKLKQLARNAKMPGFRPGKVPMKIVAQTYGPQVRNEVLGDAVQKSFTDAVREANLRVAGYPKIEPKQCEKPAEGAPEALEFSATFEIYPEVKVGELAAASIEQPKVTVDDAAVDRTIEILRKQRARFVPASRPARDADRVTMDFAGTLDGQPFEGGKAENFVMTVGEGRMLPQFEAAVRGMAPGESKSFPVKFPDDYHGKAVAGKQAEFEVNVKDVQEPELPALDAEFAKSLGVADGDVAKMRSEIRANVEREVRKRVEARLKNQAMDALLVATPMELPKSLVEMEAQQLVQRAAADLQSRGVKLEQVPLAPQHFEETARRRVALGLIIAELARTENLQPKPAEVRAMVEQEAQSYESPAEVVKWFYMQPQRLQEMEGAALEANVVKWVLSKAKVQDKDIAFDDLMGAAA